MLRAALFDLDGVVLDTESQYTLFWEKQGLLYFPELKNFAQLIKGMTLTQIFEQYFATNTQAQKQIVEALKTFEANMNYEYIRGFEAFVTGLSKENILTAVVTSSNLPKMENVYRLRPELKNYFDAILTSEDFEYSKPNPDCYLKSLQSAHIFTVALTTSNPREIVEKYSQLVINDFTQISPSQALKLI